MSRKASARARVYLEPCSPRRASEFLRRVRSSKKLHGAWLAAPATRAAFADFVKQAKKQNRKSYFVCLLATGELAGVVNVMEIVRGLFQSAYLGYYAFEPFAGQGYMSEGLELVLTECFATLKLHRVEANIQPGNEPSKRLAKRLAFRMEGYSPRYLKIAGRWRDHERWALLVEDFRATRTSRASRTAPE